MVDRIEANSDVPGFASPPRALLARLAQRQGVWDPEDEPADESDDDGEGTFITRSRGEDYYPFPASVLGTPQPPRPTEPRPKDPKTFVRGEW